MFDGKTKSGVSIRSTQGMRTIKPESHWILVADRSHLRLFEQTKNELGPVTEVRQDVEIPEGRLKGRELLSDKPGRTFNSRDMSHHGQSGPGRHAYGKDREPELHVAEAHAHQAAEMVRNLNREGVHLTVFAEPRFKGLLRPVLEEALPKAELAFQEKGFAWLPTAELLKRF